MPRDSAKGILNAAASSRQGNILYAERQSVAWFAPISGQYNVPTTRYEGQTVSAVWNKSTRVGIFGVSRGAFIETES